MPTPVPPRSAPQDGITFSELVQPVIQSLHPDYLCCPVSLLALLAFLVIAQRPPYRMQALLEIPDLSLHERRQTRPHVRDPRWASNNSSGEENAMLRLATLAPKFWTGTAQYRASFSPDDLRDAPIAEIRVELVTDPSRQAWPVNGLRGEIQGWLRGPVA